MSDISLDIVLCFLDEAQDSLVSWERAVLDLERGDSKETLNTLFRAAHNLKGASRAVGLTEFGAFVHKVEDMIHLLLKEKMRVTPTAIGLLLDSQVALAEWLVGIRNSPTFQCDVSNLVERLAAAAAAPELSHPTEAANQPMSQGTPVAAPSEGDDLEAIFLAAQQEYIATEAPVHGGGSQKQSVLSSSPSPVLSPKPTKESSEVAEPKAVKTAETVRIAAGKLDELIQLVGELSTHQTIIQQGIRAGRLQSKICQNALHLSHKLTKDLHTKAMSLRMQPIQALFQRLERVSRDVARGQGKSIDVVAEGVDVELDKSVIERMTDPLIHILRNAVDHGVESPEGRNSAGKTPVATVKLSASKDPAGVLIRVSDDGKGLDTQRILAKARQRGLVPEGATPPEAEIFKLIFLPGFSTAERVTDISGRGVGMDVVMKAIQSLQGSIDIQSQVGKGTTFSISLPTSLNVVDALVISMGSVRYAVPMHELTEIIDLSTYRIDSSGNRGQMLCLRGSVVPVQRLSAFLSASTGQRGLVVENVKQRKGVPALIVKESGKAIAFEVDTILGQQQVVVRPLAEQLAGVTGFSGCTILGDGEPGLIVSLGDIAKSYFSRFPTENRV